MEQTFFLKTYFKLLEGLKIFFLLILDLKKVRFTSNFVSPHEMFDTVNMINQTNFNEIFFLSKNKYG